MGGIVTLLAVHLPAGPAQGGGGMGTAATVAAILASAVIVLGGLVALVRAIWRVAVTLRDNTHATARLTSKLEDLTTSIDGRFDQLAARVVALEQDRDGCG